MAEKIGSLLGILAVCAITIGGCWYVLQDIEEEPTPDRAGDPISENDQAWLQGSAERTLVDVGDVRADLLTLQSMVQQGVDENLAVAYRAVGGPPDGSGPMIGAVGTAMVREMPDPARLFAVGFDLVDQTPAPPVMYPATGPQPQLAYPTVTTRPPPTYATVPSPEPVLFATSELGDLVITRVGDLYELTFSVRRDIDPTTVDP